MKIFNAFGAGLLVTLMVVTWAQADDQYHHYTLDEFTSMELHLVADQATRLIFPFVLSDEAFEPRINYSIVPEDVFSVTRVENIQGQPILILENSLTADQVASQFSGDYSYRPIRGQFFLSVAGYNLSIRLITSAKPDDQLANVVFDLTPEDRQHLINLELERHKESLSQQLEQERGQIREQARELALDELMLVVRASPTTNWLRYERRSQDRNLLYYVDHVAAYDDTYYALHFSLQNDGPGTVFIEDIQHYVVNADANRRLNGRHSCLGRLERRQEVDCVLITTDASVMSARRVKAEVVTSEGTHEVTW